jgi:uncharacterized membrane protein YcfT
MSPAAASRIAWVDHAKGICIVLVVLMHSTLGVEKAFESESWLNGFIEWARPFRMPDFFLLSGLFLQSRIARPWRAYLDTKVIHFAYFYLLWMTIQFAVKFPQIAAEEGGTGGALAFYALSLVEPFGTLWFIYLLAVFFVAAKLLDGLNRFLVLLAAAVLEALHLETGFLVVDEFAARFVYFYAGYLFAPAVFALADRLAALPASLLLAGLAAWAAVNGILVAEGLSRLPGVSLAMGFAGALAVVAAAGLMARSGLFGWLRTCGQSSIVIYLAFFLFMAASRTALVKAGVIADAGTVALLVTAAGVVGPLVLARLVRGTPLRFLFERPHILSLGRGGPAAAHRLAAE